MLTALKRTGTDLCVCAPANWPPVAQACGAGTPPHGTLRSLPPLLQRVVSGSWHCPTVQVGTGHVSMRVLRSHEAQHARPDAHARPLSSFALSPVVNAVHPSLPSPLPGVNEAQHLVDEGDTHVPRWP